MSSNVVVICGAPGAGKSTVFVEYLKERHGFKGISFADPGRVALAAALNVPVEMFGSGNKSKIEPATGKSYRELLQTFLTGWGRNMVNEDIWINRSKNFIENSEAPVVIDALFYPNELDYLISIGATIIWIDSTERETEQLNGHDSQAFFELIKSKASHTIHNRKNSTVTELRCQMDKLLNL